METLETIIWLLFSLIVLKSFTFGSDFSIYWWIRDGKKYWQWHTKKHEELYSDYRKKQ